MGVNSLPKTITRPRRGCDLNPGSSALESSTLTTRLPLHILANKTTFKTDVDSAFSPDKPALNFDCSTATRACSAADAYAAQPSVVLYMNRLSGQHGMYTKRRIS